MPSRVTCRSVCDKLLGPATVLYCHSYEARRSTEAVRRVALPETGPGVAGGAAHAADPSRLRKDIATPARRASRNARTFLSTRWREQEVGSGLAPPPPSRPTAARRARRIT